MQAEKIKASCQQYNKRNEYIQGLSPEYIYVQFDLISLNRTRALFIFSITSYQDQCSLIYEKVPHSLVSHLRYKAVIYHLLYSGISCNKLFSEWMKVRSQLGLPAWQIPLVHFLC